MDLTKHPAPWTVLENKELGGWCIYDASGQLLLMMVSEAIAQRICLWRNAEEIAMRRGWSAILCSRGWFAAHRNGDTVESAYTLSKNRNDSGLAFRFFTDPFTAIVEADIWLKAHEAPPREDTP